LLASNRTKPAAKEPAFATDPELEIAM